MAAPPTVAGIVQVLTGEAEDDVGDGAGVELHPEHGLPGAGRRVAVVTLDEDVPAQMQCHLWTVDGNTRR